ncbi:DUF456 domain-containing protein [Rhodohalobacter mucosus]|uniref:DUF456 domain-containing protein n=1 Tax=Rhodohalobacter mucosus TaxID=2079485 RepID=A0A316TPZ6_9BACT|nr:DUF456 domain-containing protein [Rhodohalobacter mucosus]PWN05741.1 DUF456 domain-containing protein [Rhodohalobacter mucosus]
MDIILVIIGAVLILFGIAGAFLPVVPGLPFSYLGLLVLQFSSAHPFGVMFFVYWALVVVVVMSLENIMPAVGARRFGGSREGIIGCLAGAVVGLFFFPPFGIVIGPIVGAFLGELTTGKTSNMALQSAIGSFIGFFVGTVIKVVTALIMAWYFFTNLP